MDKKKNVPKFAFFDLDHTLLPHDTQLLFCNFVLQKKPWRRLIMPIIIFFMPVAFLIGGIKLMKRCYLSFLLGLTKTHVKDLAKNFSKDICANFIYKKMVKKINAFKSDGIILVLNSASPSIYVQEIAGELGFKHYFETKVKDYGRFPPLPEIIGDNNKNKAKIPPMLKELNQIYNKNGGSPLLLNSENLGCWAFSDSMSDVPLLNLAEHKILINPNANLSNWGKANRAEIWRTQELEITNGELIQNKSIFKRYIYLFKQFFGFYNNK